MPRLLILIVALVLLIVGAVWLAGCDGSQPLTRVEKPILGNAIAS